MPIYRNDKKVVAVYRGGEKVTKAYRGGNVVFSSTKPLLGAAIKGKSAVSGTRYNKVRINGKDIAYTPDSEGNWEIDASLLPESITSLQDMFTKYIDTCTCEDPYEVYPDCTSVIETTTRSTRTDLLEVEFTDLFNANKVTDASYMFFGVSGLKLKNLPKLPSRVKMDNMFDSANLHDADTKATIKAMRINGSKSNMFARMGSDTDLDLSGWDFVSSIWSNSSGVFRSFKGKLTMDDIKMVNDPFRWLQDFNGTKLSIANPDMSKCTNLSRCFYNLWLKGSLDVSTWDVSKVTKFYNCFNDVANTVTSITGLDKWNMSSATSLDNMFYSYDFDIHSFDAYLFNLADIEKWDTSKVTSFSGCFQGCQHTSFDLSHWTCNGIGEYGEVINVSLFAHMFSNCDKAEIIDISGFNIPDSVNVIDKNPYYYGMFFGCSSLTTIHFSENWDLLHLLPKKTIYSEQPFESCSALTTITGVWKNLNKSLDMHWSPLTHDSALIILNALIEVTDAQTLTLSAKTYATLTHEEIATATAKNWTIAQT